MAMLPSRIWVTSSSAPATAASGRLMRFEVIGVKLMEHGEPVGILGWTLIARAP